jgi:hypothetical protein
LLCKLVSYPFPFMAVLGRLGIDIAGSWLDGAWPRLWGHVDGCLFFVVQVGLVGTREEDWRALVSVFRPLMVDFVLVHGF